VRGLTSSCGISAIVAIEAVMKNSKEYAKKIQALYRTLSHKYSAVQAARRDGVVDSIVYALVSAELTEKEAESAMARFAEYFVDWNDLRVSRVEEVVEVLGKDTSATKGIASTIIRVLRSIFDEFHKVELEGLKKTGKRPARQALEKIDGMTQFAVDYCTLVALRGHAIPLTSKMLEYLRTNGLVTPDADEQQIAGFLTKQVPAKNGYAFYALLRQESEKSRSPRKKKTKTAAKKTAKTRAKTQKKAKK
jgi:endonuclease III